MSTLQKSKRDSSELLRKLVRLGVTIKENGGYYLESPLNTRIPLEDIDFGEEGDRLHFYIEDELLRDAQRAFMDDEQKVLRKAIRLAIWSIHSLNDEQKIALLHSQETYIDPTSPEFPEQEKILQFLEPTNTSEILIITGSFGSGKTHLINQAIALLKDPQAAAGLSDENLRQQIERLSKLYQILNVGHVEEPREKILEHLSKKYTREKDSILEHELVTLINEITAARPLLITLELSTPNEMEKIEFVGSTKNTKYIIEANQQVADQLSKSRLRSKAITIVLNLKPKIIKLALKPEKAAMRADDNP